MSNQNTPLQDPTQLGPKPEFSEPPLSFPAVEAEMQSPMGRPAQPAELAPVYVFLASQEASYVNGMIYGVTGGTPLF